MNAKLSKINFDLAAVNAKIARQNKICSSIKRERAMGAVKIFWHQGFAVLAVCVVLLMALPGNI